MELKNKRPAGWFYPWAIVGILWLVAFLNYFDRNLIASMRDPIAAEFKLTDAQFGLLTTVFLLSYGILSPLGGYLADKYGRKRIIVFSVCVWSAVTLWTGFVSSFPEMLVARVIMGISEACYIPAGLAMIADYHKGKTRSLATGLHMSGLYAGQAFGGVGGYMSILWGWRYGFQMIGLFGVVYGIILIYFLHDNKNKRGDETVSTNPEIVAEERLGLFQTIKMLVSEKSFLVLLFYFCMLGIVNWMIYGWLPTFLKEHFTLGLGKAGLSATGYVQIGSFMGVLLGGIVADRWFRTNKRSRLYMIVIGFTLGGPFLFLMASTHVFTIAVVAMIIYGLARGINDSNLMPILCQVIDGKYIATGYGFLNFLSTIIGGIMVYIGGMMMDAHISLAIIYEVSAVFMVIAAWSLLRIKISSKS
ncbi:MAG: transporter [Mucilaginibacter sp.]|uniref:MFS transporter n=1 Tax=Mucilaginibacter sp. TaxID=1882438 RepID=UPI00260A4011|nr:MFS transporter [Mucilaginibacter sp.]MDB5003646.1 transporter [Mucilaginibacter sp.]